MHPVRSVRTERAPPSPEPRMSRPSLPHVAATLAVALSARAAGAQYAPRPASLAVQAGVAVPTGAFADAYAPGLTLGVALDVRRPAWPVGVRLEGSFAQHDVKRSLRDNLFPGERLEASARILAAIANVVVGAPAPRTVRPYLVAGVGAYRIREEITFATGGVSATNAETITRPGGNAGAGIDVQLAGVSAFAEARYHYVLTKNAGEGRTTNVDFVPITVGVRF